MSLMLIRQRSVYFYLRGRFLSRHAPRLMMTLQVLQCHFVLIDAAD